MSRYASRFGEMSAAMLADLAVQRAHEIERLTEALDVEQREHDRLFAELYRVVCRIAVVGHIDDCDVIRRTEVLEIIASRSRFATTTR